MTVAVQSVFTDRRSKVLADTRTSQLVVVATDPEQSAVDTLVAQLDTPTRQVLIETKLVEISSNPSTSKGINWSGTLAAQNVSFGNNLLQSQTSLAPGYNSPYGVTTSSAISSSSSSSNGAVSAVTGILGQQLAPSLGSVANTAAGFGSIGFLNADGVNAVISFLNSSVDAQVVSTPRVVTLDNEPAMISVTPPFRLSMSPPARRTRPVVPRLATPT